MTYLQLETRIIHYETFRNRFFDSNRQRKTPTVIRHLLSSPRQQTTLWPKAPDFALEHTFIFKSICNNYFIVKFIKMYILWYLLELSDPIIENENSALPILIKKNFIQKIYSCVLKMSSIFFKEGKSNFFDWNGREITEISFSTSCKKFKVFLFILFEKRRLAEDIFLPKAADSPLLR